MKQRLSRTEPMTPAGGDGIARDEILYLPLKSIDPDPEQPRLDVDDELAESIKQHGVLQAIQVRPHPVDADRWMLVDGERRYRGSLRAKLETIPATITLEVEDVGDRIVRQLVRNEGKPLTPVEEALAFKKIIEAKHAAGDKKYGVVQLARDLGIAKSTVSDRLALTEIPVFWLELIAKGPLQASHAPLLHKWRKVPEKYQLHALGQMREDPRWPGGASYSKGKRGERIYVGEFETLLRTYMPKFVKPVSEVPGYVGPTETMKVDSFDKSKVYAMDPSKWQPIWRKKLAEKKSAQGKRAAKTKETNKARVPRWVTVAVDAGAQLVDKDYFNVWNFDYDFKRSTPILDRSQWHFEARGREHRPFDPSVLLREQDLSKLIIVRCTSRGYGSQGATIAYYAATRDTAAMGQARSAFIAARREAWESIIEAFGTELLASAQKAGRDALIMGGAAPSLVKAIVDGDPQTLSELLYSYALAAKVDGVNAVKPEKPADILKWLQSLDREPAETILNAIAAAERDNLDPPPARIEAWEAATLATYAKAKPVWGGSDSADLGDDADAPDSADAEVSIEATADDVEHEDESDSEIDISEFEEATV